MATENVQNDVTGEKYSDELECSDSNKINYSLYICIYMWGSLIKPQNELLENKAMTS